MKTNKIALSFVLFISFLITNCLSSCQSSFKEDGDFTLAGTVESKPGSKKFLSGDVPYQNKIQPMVIYASDNGKFYLWLKLQTLGMRSEERRAQEIAGRLEAYRQERMTNISWGKLNNQNIICVYTEEKKSDCQIIVTVPNDKKVENILVLLRCKYSSPDDPKCLKPAHS